MDMKYWSLKNYDPRTEQITVIDKIAEAIECDYSNIILEAGTGTGKSAIATTVAKMCGDSYILTMTNQLQSQYLQDFNYMLHEIKGRNNYACNYGGYCNNCQMEIEGEKRCEDCLYLQHMLAAQESSHVLTNYDYLYYSGNYANQWDKRDLLILDEAHNFEKKIMSLVSEDLNRYVIYDRYGFDIFEHIMKRGALKDINNTYYWYEIVSKCLDKELQMPVLDQVEKKKHENYIKKYERLLKRLRNEEYIIELPLKKDILADTTMDSRLKVEFKPLEAGKYSDSILQFSETRLFMTGTLGDVKKFCEWNGLNYADTYYIYQKSPFPIENRPIIRRYVTSMKQDQWKNPHIVKYIKKIIESHKNEKGVIHTSSNQQAWFIKKQLNSNKVWVAQGKSRESTIKQFEESNNPIILVGAGLKDGVDFKHDKCRYQILFKIPFPSLGSQQVKIRRRTDPVWYIYQTVMPLMQSYGRGIRDMDDYCKYYVLDMDFQNLIDEYKYLFNEYFLEAIQ